jgi:riboflavin-specific deaminase-like protein
MQITVITALTIDGYIGHSLAERLNLSSEADIADVRRLRAGCDAILVGAATLRKDNSALITRDESFINQRKNLGKCSDPVKVTVTRTGDISPDSQFINLGSCEKIVYASGKIDPVRAAALEKLVTLKKFDTTDVTATQIVEDLEARGIQNLIVEGGTQILTMFFIEDLVHNFRLSIAPFFVGEENAPRLTGHGLYKFNKNNRMKLVKVEQLGDTAVMHYKLNDTYSQPFFRNHQ